MIQSTKKIDRELLPHAFFSLSYVVVVVEAALALSRGMETQILNYEAINGSDTLWTPTQTDLNFSIKAKQSNSLQRPRFSHLAWNCFCFLTAAAVGEISLESAGRIEKLILARSLFERFDCVMRPQGARAASSKRLFGLSAMRHGNLINTSRWVNHLSSSTDG
jgi:hypothetical protein